MIFFRKKEKKDLTLQHEKALKERYKNSAIYPDFPSISFFYNYFYKKAFENYILNVLRRYKSEFDKNLLILELGSHKSRNADLLPEDLREKIIISDINLNILRENTPSLYKIQLDFDFVPFKDRSIPFILGTNIFSHLLGLGNIEEIKRVLSKEGVAMFIEDLNLYMPALALFFEKQGYKTYFLLDPYEGLKCFVIEKEQFEKLRKELKEKLKQIDLSAFKKEIEENFSEGTLDYFEGLIKEIKEKTYENDPFAFSLSLFAFTNQFKTEFLSKSPEEIQKLQILNQGFNNFLILLRNTLRTFSKFEIRNWDDVIDYIKEFLENHGLSLEIEHISIESNLETLKKYQEELKKKISDEEMSFHHPYWGQLLELKNLIIENMGLEIGYKGEQSLNEPNVVKYNMLIITIKK